MDMLSIGEMAKINQVSVQTLRLYDRMGLLTPHFTGPNRYRYYDVKQSARLDMIQNLQTLGMSLKEIKEQLDRQDVSAMEDLLFIQKERLEQRIAQMVTIRKSIERAIANYRRYGSTPRDGTIFTEFMAQRKIYRYDSGINFYDFGLETYEYILRELKKHISLNRLPMAYFCNVGTIMRKERLLRRDFVSTEVFVFVDDDFQCGQSDPLCRSNLEILPSQSYICISCDKFHKERAYAERLLDHVEGMGYSISGDYLCEVITDLPVFVDNERGMSIKIQIPVDI